LNINVKGIIRVWFQDLYKSVFKILCTGASMF